MVEVWFEKSLRQRKARKAPVREMRGLTPEEAITIAAAVRRKEMVEQTLKDLRESGVVTGTARRGLGFVS